LKTKRIFLSTVCNRLADKLGLVYISTEGVMQDFVQNASQFQDHGHLEGVPSVSPMLLADEVVTYLQSGSQVPQYINYKILDFALMEPR